MSPRRRSPKIAAVDLFCGAGGLTHGLIEAGIDVRAGIDLDPACRYPFEQNNGSAKFVERDVKDLGANDLRPFFKGSDYTLLAGCAPCQPFSTYSRSGRSKKRELDWQLVSNFGELVSDLQPDLVSMENVTQLADHDVFAKFLDHLDGYHISWSAIECTQLGIPQTRRRLVLLASRLGPDNLSLSNIVEPARTVRQTISELPVIAAGQQDAEDRLHTASSLSQLNMRRIEASRPGGTWRDWPPDLLASCHRKMSGASYPSVYGRMEWDAPSPTITTQCFGYGNGRFGHPEQDRAISLREAAMLQTFPRTYRFVPDDEPVRFNVLGRLIGNAVPVKLGEAVGRTLVRHVGAPGSGKPPQKRAVPQYLFEL
ncbi:DNA cytosine methyltransferase [Dactylosporangium sp. CA-233914]|uniref:DNA cytosine methyltransferase n=1 Tax=Dactylosporangium sp. CA-233914 TaxID=3239934 RepID=UPI003D930E39